jgi:hypothetical protein
VNFSAYVLFSNLINTAQGIYKWFIFYLNKLAVQIWHMDDAYKLCEWDRREGVHIFVDWNLVDKGIYIYIIFKNTWKNEWPLGTTCHKKVYG